MIERPHSTHLMVQKQKLVDTIGLLAPSFDYVSVLGTDDRGISFAAQPGETRTYEPTFVQRGFVFRAQKAGKVVEYATSALPGEDASSCASFVKERIYMLLEGKEGKAATITYPTIPDEPLTEEFHGTLEIDPMTAEPESVLAKLSDLRTRLTDGKVVVSSMSRFDFVDVSRIFVSPHRQLFQSFGWAQAYLFGYARKGASLKTSYRSTSGRKGLEILDDLAAQSDALARELSELLDAQRIEPGEYEVILDPDMAGTLAHEAFGHGVETDMFFKGRAKAVEYLGKRVGSDLVTMYDGAAGVDQTGSFLFDDEGTVSTRTLIIDHGILKSGISDELSALALGIPLTGNGRRQAFSHKAYARMTNTYFAPGASSYEEMLASVKYGWQLSRLNSGMEDPRNWGIQLFCLVGREIVDGKFSGRVASPIVCSGYVPDVLAAISMVSGDFELSGSGYCGKGHKEHVKVSSGGPYVKTRMRLA